mmetsp:Transcript_18358/g.44330  ORF Transcript_18358/g.44330 Transcript_18358/m.44330 type:complete len:85 (+) Transcript_18358:27-281(+)
MLPFGYLFTDRWNEEDNIISSLLEWKNWVEQGVVYRYVEHAPKLERSKTEMNSKQALDLSASSLSIPSLCRIDSKQLQLYRLEF